MDKLDELIMKAAETYVDPDVERIMKMDTSTVESSPRMQRFGEALKVYERDITGAVLFPGYPEFCRGNGEHPAFEICCDECDYYLACFPEYQGEVNEALEDLRDRKNKTLSERLVGVLSSDIDEKAAREERAKNLLEEGSNG